MSTTETRTRILDAAERLFFNEGIAVTGIDEVAREAGVAIATLYKHGGSKEQVLADVLERRLESWSAHWDAAVESATDPHGRVLAVFDAVTAFRADALPTQWCCFLAARSERPTADEADDPVAALVSRDGVLLRRRLLELVEQAGSTAPADVVADLVLLYNGALASLLRADPDDAVARARRLAAARLREADVAAD